MIQRFDRVVLAADKDEDYLGRIRNVADVSFRTSYYGGFDRGKMIIMGSKDDPLSKYPWGRQLPICLVHQKKEGGAGSKWIWWYGYGVVRRDSRYSKNTILVELYGLQEYLKNIYPGEDIPVPSGCRYVDPESGDPKQEISYKFFKGICFAKESGSLYERYESGIRLCEFSQGPFTRQLEVIEDVFPNKLLVIRVRMWEDIINWLVDYYLVRHASMKSFIDGQPIYPFTGDEEAKNMGPLLSISEKKIFQTAKVLHTDFQVLKFDGSETLFDVLKDIAIMLDSSFWVGSYLSGAPSDPVSQSHPKWAYTSITNRFIFPSLDDADFKGGEKVYSTPPKGRIKRMFLNVDPKRVSEIEEEVALDSLINSVTLKPGEMERSGSLPGNKTSSMYAIAEDKASIRRWGKHEIVVEASWLDESNRAFGEFYAGRLLEGWGFPSGEGERMRRRMKISVPGWIFYPPPLASRDIVRVKGRLNASESRVGSLGESTVICSTSVTFNQSPEVTIEYGTLPGFRKKLESMLGTGFGNPKNFSTTIKEGRRLESNPYRTGDHHSEVVPGSEHVRVRSHLIVDDDIEYGPYPVGIKFFPYTQFYQADEDGVVLSGKEAWIDEEGKDDISTVVYGKVWDQEDTLRHLFEFFNYEPDHPGSEAEVKKLWNWHLWLRAKFRPGKIASSEDIHLDEGYVDLDPCQDDGTDLPDLDLVKCWIIGPGLVQEEVNISLEAEQILYYLPIKETNDKEGILINLATKLGVTGARAIRIVSYDGLDPLPEYTVQPVIMTAEGFENDGDTIANVVNYGEVQADEYGYWAGPSGEDIYLPLYSGGGVYYLMSHPPRMP